MYSVTELNNHDMFDSNVVRDNETGRYRIDYMMKDGINTIQSVAVPSYHEIVDMINRHHAKTMAMMEQKAHEAIADIENM